MIKSMFPFSLETLNKVNITLDASHSTTMLGLLKTIRYFILRTLLLIDC